MDETSRPGRGAARAGRRSRRRRRGAVTVEYMGLVAVAGALAAGGLHYVKDHSDVLGRAIVQPAEQLQSGG